MPKEKKIIYFSRNGVRISKTLYIDMTKFSNIRVNRKTRIYNTYPILEFGTHVSPKERNQEHEIKLESPLGFWYIKSGSDYSQSNEVPDKKATIFKISLLFDGVLHELEYPWEYNGAKVGTDMRPWDILPGHEGMPGHFIKDLYKEASNFLDTIEALAIPENWEETRKGVMKDLFGISGKPEIQPNDIKILSHGFDLKESFRKRKEV